MYVCMYCIRTHIYHEFPRCMQVRFYTPGPADPLAALRADPAVRTFEIKQDRHPIPVAPATTYDHLCIPLRAAWGGPLNSTSKQHMIAFEAIVDPTSPRFFLKGTIIIIIIIILYDCNIVKLCRLRGHRRPHLRQVYFGGVYL